jgi:hypothetical protein
MSKIKVSHLLNLPTGITGSKNQALNRSTLFQTQSSHITLISSISLSTEAQMLLPNHSMLRLKHSEVRSEVSEILHFSCSAYQIFMPKKYLSPDIPIDPKKAA